MLWINTYANSFPYVLTSIEYKEKFYKFLTWWYRLLLLYKAKHRKNFCQLYFRMHSQLPVTFED
jgi:hypothetical protein